MSFEMPREEYAARYGPTTGDRVRAVAGTRIVYCNGVPLAALEGDYIKQLAPIDTAIANASITPASVEPCFEVFRKISPRPSSG